MAWMNQERKAVLVGALKKVIPGDWKWTARVTNHSTITVIIRQAPVDLLQELREKGFDLSPESMYLSMSRSTATMYLSAKNAAIFEKVFDILHGSEYGYYDKSDAMTDYFDTAWYAYVSIGEWNDPFLHVIPKPKKIKGYVPLGKKYGSGSYDFSDKLAKKGIGAYAESKIKQYLPSGWAHMTPGKKAAATKKAMKLAGYA